MSEQSLFERLSAIDCRDHIEKKGKFSYLSWTWAWATLKKHCPEARFQKHTFRRDCSASASSLESTYRGAVTEELDDTDDTDDSARRWEPSPVEAVEASNSKDRHFSGDVPYMTDEDGYAYVKVTVFTNDDVQTEVFPVLNHSNKPIQRPNSFDVNTALQRCLVKAIAMLGLGLYIYAGEDVPEGAEPLAPYTKKEEKEMYDQHSSGDLGEMFT